MDVSPERFEELVVDALDAIPEDLGTEMENVAVFIEEWPTAEQLGGRGGTLFGLYEGVSLTRRSPDQLLRRVARSHHDLPRPDRAGGARRRRAAGMVTTTVVHEIAHHFGISDERLEELGWG